MCYVVGVMPANDLPSTVRDTLARLATTGDRTSPAVFAGREGEFRLLNDAAQRVAEGQRGHTVVIEGVPGAGKTALLDEYAARLMAADAEASHPIVPVPLRPGDLDNPPAAILQEVDRQFSEFEASKEWERSVNRIIGGASLVANTLFAHFTKRGFDEFKPSARAPNSLPVALDEYVSLRLGRRDSTILLLVDEAQNLNDTRYVRHHLDVLHGGVRGRAQVMLACFGLTNTTERLRELGLSRLAKGHARTIGPLSAEDAKHTVTGTLELALADYPFDRGSRDETVRSQWIATAADTILAESANFPHHLANGCHALAGVVLDEGVGDAPPVAKLRDLCREHKREYYDARLRPWFDHTIALAHAFGRNASEWTPYSDVRRALIASDNTGDPVEAKDASRIVRELRACGYIEGNAGSCRPALPSLADHFKDMLYALAHDDEVAQAIRSALPNWHESVPTSSSQT